MAMNKKERAAFKAAQQQAADALALGWPSEPEPQPMTREEIERLAKLNPDKVAVGWFMNPFYSDSWNQMPKQGCSSGYSHSESSTVKTNSQNMGRMYRTEEDALVAQRWELCRKMARRLAQLDARRKEIAS